MLHRAFVGTTALLLLSLLTSVSFGDLRIDPQHLDRLPSGSAPHASLKPEPKDSALQFSDGGIVLPTAGLITASAGSIDLQCQVPADWPANGDRALFNAKTAAHVHVTLFLRNGALAAVYKGSEERFASINYPAAGTWKPGSWHRVQFGWQPFGKEVEFVLMVDGTLAGVSSAQLIEKWPATCEVGVRDGRTPWKGLLRDIVLSQKPIAIPGLEPGRRTLTVHADREVGELYRFWTVANYNKPHQFTDPAFVSGIKRGQPYITQANAVYLLGGRYRDQATWFQGVGPDGSIRADFTGMIAQLKAMQDGGFTPWPVLDNVPYNMSEAVQENTYGNTAPAKDVRVWGRYVEAALRAMVQAFGKETVARWWFRVGTEPDLCPGHWAGTREQWLAHYDQTVAAFERVIPEAKIGPGNILNPAGGEFGTHTREQWGLSIIDHAAAGTNSVTGRKGTRMDWFSFSWYARIGQPISQFDQAVSAIRSRLDRYPQYAKLPLIVGEFTILHDDGGRHTPAGDASEWGASFYAALADRVYRYDIRQVYEWAQTTVGVPHPRTSVIGMLQDMSGGRRLAVDTQAAGAADCGAIACRKNDELMVLVYNHRGLRRPKLEEHVDLVLRDPRMKAGQKWKLSQWDIDAEHGCWAYAFAADCEAAGIKMLPAAAPYQGAIGRTYGKPGEALFVKNRSKYAQLADPVKTVDAQAIIVGDGVFNLGLDLPGHSVRLLRLSPVPQNSLKK